MFRFRRSTRYGIIRMFGSVSNRSMRISRKRYAGNIVRFGNRKRRFKR